MYVILDTTTARVSLDRSPRLAFGSVEILEASASFGEVTHVKRVRVHFHEEDERVHSKKNLRGPGPFQDERPADVHGKPQGLENTLDDDAAFVPPEDAVAAHVESVQ